MNKCVIKRNLVNCYVAVTKVLFLSSVKLIVFTCYGHKNFLTNLCSSIGFCHLVTSSYSGRTREIDDITRLIHCETANFVPNLGEDFVSAILLTSTGKITCYKQKFLVSAKSPMCFLQSEWYVRCFIYSALQD